MPFSLGVANCYRYHKHVYTNLSTIRWIGIVKLSEWARQQDIHYMTAWRWWRGGKLPVPAYQTPSGSVLVTVPAAGAGRTAVYTRVGSSVQASDLDRQVARLTAWATANGHSVEEVITEVGSGLNGRRRKLLRMLADPTITTIVVEHRDRLARVGVEVVRAALTAQGRRIIIVDADETTDDLGRDMLEVLTSFCARLYGWRGARTRALVAVKAAKRGV